MDESQRRMAQAREAIARWNHAEVGSFDETEAGNAMANLLTDWLEAAEKITGEVQPQ